MEINRVIEEEGKKKKKKKKEQGKEALADTKQAESKRKFSRGKFKEAMKNLR